jgi:hypothetical protein
MESWSTQRAAGELLRGSTERIRYRCQRTNARDFGSPSTMQVPGAGSSSHGKDLILTSSSLAHFDLLYNY